MPPLLQQACGVIVGRDYPAPIVDETEGLAFARARITAARRAIRDSAEGRAMTDALLARHGSRRRQSRQQPPPSSTTSQLALNFVGSDDFIDDDPESDQDELDG